MYLSEDLNREFQNVSSPGFRASGAGRYPRSAQCTWRLRVLADLTLGLRIQVRLVSLDVQFSYGCRNDYLEVREPLAYRTPVRAHGYKYAIICISANVSYAHCSRTIINNRLLRKFGYVLNCTVCE